MKKKILIETDLSGCCPRCGSNDIDYGAFELEGIFYPATCEDCGLKFQECYNLEFVESVAYDVEVEEEEE